MQVWVCEEWEGQGTTVLWTLDLYLNSLALVISFIGILSTLSPKGIG